MRLTWPLPTRGHAVRFQVDASTLTRLFQTKPRRVNTYFFFQLGRRQEMSFVCDGKIFLLIFLLGAFEEVTTSHLTCILQFIKKKKKGKMELKLRLYGFFDT